MLFTNLYHRYLRGELSAEELASLKEKVPQISDDELWYIMEEEASRGEKITMSVADREEILERLHGKMRKPAFSNFLKYAAAILVLLVSVSGALLFYKSSKHGMQPMAQVVVAPGNKAKMTLPDGTVVEMNSGTVMQYAVEKHGRREVVIKSGEAFFDVAKDRQHPFHVTVNDMRIEVMGTTFNVNAYGPQVSTSLFTGVVKLTSKSLKNTYTLKPGDKSVYETTNHKMLITQNDKTEDLGWRDGYLVFNSLPLKDVIAKIERWYGVRIKLANPKFADDKLTGSFHNETLESVLHSLGMQYKFNYKTQKDLIIVN